MVKSNTVDLSHEVVRCSVHGDPGMVSVLLGSKISDVSPFASVIVSSRGGTVTVAARALCGKLMTYVPLLFTEVFVPTGIVIVEIAGGLACASQVSENLKHSMCFPP